MDLSQSQSESLSNYLSNSRQRYYHYQINNNNVNNHLNNNNQFNFDNNNQDESLLSHDEQKQKSNNNINANSINTNNLNNNNNQQKYNQPDKLHQHTTKQTKQYNMDNVKQEYNNIMNIKSKINPQLKQLKQVSQHKQNTLIGQIASSYNMHGQVPLISSSSSSSELSSSHDSGNLIKPLHQHLFAHSRQIQQTIILLKHQINDLKLTNQSKDELIHKLYEELKFINEKSQYQKRQLKNINIKNIDGLMERMNNNKGKMGKDDQQEDSGFSQQLKQINFNQNQNNNGIAIDKQLKDKFKCVQVKFQDLQNNYSNTINHKNKSINKHQVHKKINKDISIQKKYKNIYKKQQEQKQYSNDNSSLSEYENMNSMNNMNNINNKNNMNSYFQNNNQISSKSIQSNPFIKTSTSSYYHKNHNNPNINHNNHTNFNPNPNLDSVNILYFKAVIQQFQNKIKKLQSQLFYYGEQISWMTNFIISFLKMGEKISNIFHQSHDIVKEWSLKKSQTLLEVCQTCDQTCSLGSNLSVGNYWISVK